jgi:hypothetical protein
MGMTFDTKVAVVVRDDLPVWQKLNVTAFTISGIAGTDAALMGDPYEDGSGNVYLPMIRQPILVFEASAEQIRKVYERAMKREVRFTIYTEDLFATGNDIDNRAAVKAVPADALNIVGMAMHDRKKTIDRVLEGVSLHR